MNYLYIITGLAIIISFIANTKKTYKALKTAFNQLIKILLPFITMIILVAVTLYFVPDKIILKYLSNNNTFYGIGIASLFGSISLMPGFIAYPLSGILLEKGVSYVVLSAFTTTLMMVGIVTYPIEKKYYGAKITLIRNLIGYVIALIVALVTGALYGEIF